MNPTTRIQYEEELRRLRGYVPPRPVDLSGPTQIDGHVNDISPVTVVERVRSILAIANEFICAGKRPDQADDAGFPAWFIAACAAEEDWDLISWLSWFEPSERTWFWWDGRVVDEQSIVIEVVSDGLPFLWGALEWLLLAAGCEHAELDLWY